jgi:methylmalonyl-CoA/ethylmalonyl-CoA epimerase
MLIEDKIKINKVLQVALVVKDLQQSMKMYWEVFGIGPWRIITFQPPALTNPTVCGKPEPYTMRLGITRIGDIQWELIQPLTGNSIYKEFLDKHGEGLHHVAVDVGDYDRAISLMKKQDIEVLMSGQMRGDSFAYMDTERVLGTIIEIYKRTADYKPIPPEATYPPDAKI